MDIESYEDALCHGLPPWLWLRGVCRFHHNPRDKGAGLFGSTRSRASHHGLTKSDL